MVGEMARFQLTPLISIRARGKLENAPRANTSRGHVSLVDLINFGQRGLGRVNEKQASPGWIYVYTCTEFLHRILTRTFAATYFLG